MMEKRCTSILSRRAVNQPEFRRPEPDLHCLVPFFDGIAESAGAYGGDRDHQYFLNAMYLCHPDRIRTVLEVPAKTSLFSEKAYG